MEYVIRSYRDGKHDVMTGFNKQFTVVDDEILVCTNVNCCPSRASFLKKFSSSEGRDAPKKVPKSFPDR